MSETMREKVMKGYTEEEKEAIEAAASILPEKEEEESNLLEGFTADQLLAEARKRYEDELNRIRNREVQLTEELKSIQQRKGELISIVNCLAEKEGWQLEEDDEEGASGSTPTLFGMIVNVMQGKPRMKASAIADLVNEQYEEYKEYNSNVSWQEVGAVLKANKDQFDYNRATGWKLA